MNKKYPRPLLVISFELKEGLHKPSLEKVASDRQAKENCHLEVVL